MLKVSDIIDQVKMVIGTCDNSVAFMRLGEAQDLLTDRLHSDATLGFMDICTDRDELTMPDDVEAPLAINIGGCPADYRNRWFEFHLNGPGSSCGCSVAWTDLGYFPTFRSIRGATTLSAVADLPTDAGTNIRVYGFLNDAAGNPKWIMTPDSTGTLVDGFDVTIDGSPSTQSVDRITRVSKPVTYGFVQLTANDTNLTLLGYFKPSDTEPQFRRIKLSGSGCKWLCECSVPTSTWVRMRFKKKNNTINDLSDLLFVDSLTAIKKTVMAIRKYEADLLPEYESYLASAVQDMRMKKKANNGPNQIKIQFQRHGFANRPGENLA